MTHPPARPLDGILVVALEQAVARRSPPVASRTPGRGHQARARRWRLRPRLRHGGQRPIGVLRVVEPRQGIARRRHQEARRRRPRAAHPHPCRRVHHRTSLSGPRPGPDWAPTTCASVSRSSSPATSRVTASPTLRRHEGLRSARAGRGRSHLDQPRARGVRPRGVSICDYATGLSAVLAINEALVERTRTGRGSAIKCLSSMSLQSSCPCRCCSTTTPVPDRTVSASPTRRSPLRRLRDQDGATLVISVQNDREWASLATEVLERPDLVDDPKYATNPARMERRAEVDGLVQAFFSRHDRAVWRPSCAPRASRTGRSTT